jgi:hypothetical protein
MRQPSVLPKVLSGRGQLFQDERSPIDVRYQIVLAVPAIPALSTVPAIHAASTTAPAGAPSLPLTQATASGSLVVLNRADLWRIDPAAEYHLALPNGRRCRVSLHHDPYQPFTKYRILCPAQDLL